MDLREAELLLTMADESRANNLMLKELTDQMATVREVLTALSEDVAGIKEDVGRVLARAQETLDQIATGNVELSPELQQQVDAVRGDLAALNQQMDSVVPPPSEPSTGNLEPAPADSTVDTSGPVPPAPEMGDRAPITDGTTEAGEPVTQANESNS